MNEISLGLDSALDLTIKGSIGSFGVGKEGRSKSLEVKYFLSHVSLNFGSGSDEKLLRELAPVREIFDPNQLDFDEIMQRDIDDARVSSELIPYILDEKKQDLIKFFPPIVIMVLPIMDDRNKPLDYYPKVEYLNTDKVKNGIENWKIIRSGQVGSEVFQFEQPILDSGKAEQHDLVSLKLNTTKCRLVIVDGQHRAMALLALYRNLKDQWGDERRKPFQKYYEEWTRKYISKFDLSNINLPMIICTIPTLDDAYKGDYDLKKASRSIFLTLNKTARKVSRTRNILLDDNDLISSFMRRTLSDIKDSDTRSHHSMKMHNVELDQDKQKLVSPIAVTGVSHLYYIVEHMLLDSGDVTGVSARSGRFKARVDFSNALDRLNGVNVLSRKTYNQTRRDNFTSDVESILSKGYNNIYGKMMLHMFQKFVPYEKHNYAVLRLQENIQNESDVDLESMLFSGQGVVKVFEDHRSNLKSKLKDGYFDTDVPRINVIVKSLDATESRLRKRIDEFRQIRAEEYASGGELSKYMDGDNVSSNIVSLIDEMYSNTFTTVAFQSAIVCGFFNEYEKTSSKFQGDTDLEIFNTFDEYLDQISDFFYPKSFNKFKRLLSVLKGSAEGEDALSLKVASSSDSFRAVVSPGEMQPDLWPRFRYLLLEIWSPSDVNFGEKIKNEREFCRSQVFVSLYNRRKKLLAQDLGILEDDMEKEQLSKVFDDAFQNMKNFLRNFERASELSVAKIKQLVHKADNNEDDD